AHNLSLIKERITMPSSCGPRIGTDSSQLFLHCLQNTVGVALGDHCGDAESTQRLGSRLVRSQKQTRLRNGPVGMQKRFGTKFWRLIADKYHVKCRCPRQFTSFGIIPSYGCIESGVFEDVLQTSEYIGVLIQNEYLTWALAHRELL